MQSRGAFVLSKGQFVFSFPLVHKTALLATDYIPTTYDYLCLLMILVPKASRIYLGTKSLTSNIGQTRRVGFLSPYWTLS